MKKSLVTTADGSHSFYIPEMDEHYHSKHGSIAESKHIFIEAGLTEALKHSEKLNLLEVGMGTGLNVYLTALALNDTTAEVHMDTIEAYPIAEEEALQLNYPQQLQADQALFQRIHQLPWNQEAELIPQLKLLKIHDKLEGYSFQKQYDLIYFDAFAPEKQEELWDEAIFQKLFEQMNEGGILVTYCVKGIIRRRLQTIGFSIEKLAGPVGGKREMLRAIKVK